VLLATRPQVNRTVTVNSRLANRAVNRAFLQPALSDDTQWVVYVAAHSVTSQQHQKQVVMCSVSLLVMIHSGWSVCILLLNNCIDTWSWQNIANSCQFLVLSDDHDIFISLPRKIRLKKIVELVFRQMLVLLAMSDWVIDAVSDVFCIVHAVIRNSVNCAKQVTSWIVHSWSVEHIMCWMSYTDCWVVLCCVDCCRTKVMVLHWHQAVNSALKGLSLLQS